MSMPRLLTTACLTAGMLFFFQNCQNAKMAASGKADDSSLARVNETSLDLPPAPAPTPTPTNPNPSPNPNPNPTPVPTPTPVVCPTDTGHDHDSTSDDDGSHDHDRHAHHKSSYGHEVCDDASSDDKSEDDCVDHSGKEDGNREYVCGISGPGQSTMVGITENEQLEAKHQGVKMLCMSKYACETVAARAFPGAHSEKRGYCKVDSNKNVKHVSDEHLTELVNKYLNEHPAP